MADRSLTLHKTAKQVLTSEECYTFKEALRLYRQTKTPRQLVENLEKILDSPKKLNLLREIALLMSPEQREEFIDSAVKRIRGSDLLLQKQHIEAEFQSRFGRQMMPLRGGGASSSQRVSRDKSARRQLLKETVDDTAGDRKGGGGGVGEERMCKTMNSLPDETLRLLREFDSDKDRSEEKIKLEETARIRRLKEEPDPRIIKLKSATFQVRYSSQLPDPDPSVADFLSRDRSNSARRRSFDAIAEEEEQRCHDVSSGSSSCAEDIRYDFDEDAELLVEKFKAQLQRSRRPLSELKQQQQQQQQQQQRGYWALNSPKRNLEESIRHPQQQQQQQQHKRRHRCRHEQTLAAAAAAADASIRRLLYSPGVVNHRLDSLETASVTSSTIESEFLAKAAEFRQELNRRMTSSTDQQHRLVDVEVQCDDNRDAREGEEGRDCGRGCEDESPGKADCCRDASGCESADGGEVEEEQEEEEEVETVEENRQLVAEEEKQDQHQQHHQQQQQEQHLTTPNFSAQQQPAPPLGIYFLPIPYQDVQLLQQRQHQGYLPWTQLINGSAAGVKHFQQQQQSQQQSTRSVAGTREVNLSKAGGGTFGLSVASASGGGGGAFRVSSVATGSPAHAQGIQPGDWILELHREPVSNMTLQQLGLAIRNQDRISLTLRPSHTTEE